MRNMKSKRGEKMEDEEEAKRQKLLHPSTASSPTQPASTNALLPLAIYEDDGDEDDNVQADLEENGHEYQEGEENRIDHREGEEEDEDDEIGVAQGHRNRMIELRRDCPYLDTVNRQVFYSSFAIVFIYLVASSELIDEIFHVASALISGWILFPIEVNIFDQILVKALFLICFYMNSVFLIL